MGALALSWFFNQRWTGARSVPAGAFATYLAVCYGAMRLLREYITQFEHLQLAELDKIFEETYAWFFIHVDAEDLRGRWVTVRPRVLNILRAAGSMASQPLIEGWEI